MHTNTSNSLTSNIPFYEPRSKHSSAATSSQNNSNNTKNQTGHYYSNNNSNVDDDDDDHTKKSTNISPNRNICGMSPATSNSVSTFTKSLFYISLARKRQLILLVLFISNFFFVCWLVDGDPTQGELLRVEQVLEMSRNEKRNQDDSKNAKKNANEADLVGASNGIYSAQASWCVEAPEVRHQWRGSQRIAGPAFRQTIDLCDPVAPEKLFASSPTTKNNNVEYDDDEETQRENSMWKKEFQMKRSETVLDHEQLGETNKKIPSSNSLFQAQCGVSRIHSRFSPSSMNASWMIFPRFLDYFEESKKENTHKKEGSEKENEHTLSSSIEIEKQRQMMHLACGARKIAHIGQLPLVDTLRNNAEIVDFAFLHSSMKKNEERSHCRKYEHFKHLEEVLKNHHPHQNDEKDDEQHHQNVIFDEAIRKMTIGTFHGSPALQSAALSAQYIAVRSCATPPLTLANVVIVDDDVDKDKDENGKNREQRSRQVGDVDHDENILSTNEFSSWRLWSGGPLISAAVCRKPPFHVTIEVSPSSSWVEIIR